MTMIMLQPRRMGKSYLTRNSDKLDSMMKDLDLIIRILDTMQDRPYLTNPVKIADREDELRRERGEYALEVIRQWVTNIDANLYPEAAIRLAMMVRVPVDRIEFVVDELAHVYERRYQELAVRAIAKQQQIQAHARNALNAQFTKKTFSPGG